MKKIVKARKKRKPPIPSLRELASLEPLPPPRRRVLNLLGFRNWWDASLVFIPFAVASLGVFGVYLFVHWL